MIQKKTVALLLIGLALPLIAAQPSSSTPDALPHTADGLFLTPRDVIPGVDIRDVTTDRWPRSN